jgi:hypothetical protein
MKDDLLLGHFRKTLDKRKKKEEGEPLKNIPGLSIGLC